MVQSQLQRPVEQGQGERDQVAETFELATATSHHVEHGSESGS